MIYLDTHVVVWLYEGLIEKFSSKAIHLIEENDLYISPMVKLELSYLKEIKRLSESSQVMIQDLQTRLGLKTCDLAFDTLVSKARELTWTRDPFDRLIVSHALWKKIPLITKDQSIHQHFKLAVWD